MSMPLYMDVHVPFAATQQLRRRGVDVVTAQDDGQTTTPDADLLDRATELGRAFVTQDEDLLAEAARRQHAGILFWGVIYGAQRKVDIGILVRDCEILALAGDPADFLNAVFFLPLP